MFVRSLAVRGFKSFADKTVLEFTPGISVIVGPNGSGKSNIVDAIAWVLGEQGPRALRGSAMTDVIFAGSPGRPALGMAEVKLIVDNSAGVIPVPASEIEISRTLYRSGDGEYRLGGRPCRLLDIQELLSDTGMGRALHTIIGQGQLDAVLSARPEERRQFVEEAAGIAKHRRRKERAERRLAGLEQDLLRLHDVLAELRRQLKPLKQQAELARRHDALTREAEELAGKLAAARLRDLYAERERRRPSWREAEARQEELRGRLADLDREIAELDQERSRAEEAERQADELHSGVERAKSEAEACLRAAIQAEAEARERLASAANRSGRLFALEDELDRTRAALAEVVAAAEAKEAELEEAERAFRVAQSLRADAEQERRRVEAAALARQAEAESLRRTLAGHEAERDQLARTRLDLRRRIEGAEARAVKLEAEVERLDSLETPLAREQGALERERGELQAVLGDLEAQQKGLLARQEVVEARQKELSESPAAAFLRRRDGRPIGILRELIDVPPDLQPALKGALGPFFDAVVYATRDDALADAAHEEASGITLAIEEDVDAIAPLPIAGERRLLEAVRPDPQVRGLATRLLSNVYLVHNLAEAAARHRAHPAAQFITPYGVVVGPSFVRTATAHDARLEEVRREAAALERELASVRARGRERRQRLAEIEGRLGVVGSELTEADRRITTAAEEMARVEGELASLRREEQLVGERALAVEAGARVAQEALAGIPSGQPVDLPALPPMPELPMGLRVEVEALRRERARLEAGVARSTREVEGLTAEDPVSMREALKRAESQRSEAEEALRNAEDNLSGGAAAHRAAAEEARTIQARHAEANRVWREVAAAAERLRLEHEEEDRARTDLERRIGEAERLVREGYGLDPREVVTGLGDDETPDQLARRRDVVARRLGLVGKVNLLAVGELESVKERHDFMARELEDVKAARRNLQEVIRHIDERMAEQFDQAFRDVAREFSALFESLFPGGEGRLTLTNPGDLLGSGIEVEARPGRGRVKRLSLLSGGERSLAALAFLFAIFRARPSPFYLMDEVEAALDDVNLVRFIDVIREFARTSQIIIVTHQKRTMETADVLYGVSMGRDGISTIISERLAEAAVR